MNDERSTLRVHVDGSAVGSRSDGEIPREKRAGDVGGETDAFRMKCTAPRAVRLVISDLVADERGVDDAKEVCAFIDEDSAAYHRDLEGVVLDEIGSHKP
ncbi:MAG: hypothetical protein FJ253_09225 [Phycisphaerae bacterium]|nr:hypothetical protein [Phycisphaerae bacterium]